MLERGGPLKTLRGAEPPALLLLALASSSAYWDVSVCTFWMLLDDVECEVVRHAAAGLLGNNMMLIGNVEGEVVRHAEVCLLENDNDVVDMMEWVSNGKKVCDDVKSSQGLEQQQQDKMMMYGMIILQHHFLAGEFVRMDYPGDLADVENVASAESVLTCERPQLHLRPGSCVS